MIRFYLNRELSASLGFKLSRWKRWSREFLPPDPLGGMQSGFARQYSLAEAFQVYMGGHLVAGLKYSVPEAKIILSDLKEWVSAQYFSYSSDEKHDFHQPAVMEYRIFIFLNLDPMQPAPPRIYAVRGLIGEKRANERGARIVTERYLERWFKDGEEVDGPDGPDALLHGMGAKILYVTTIYRMFREHLSKNELT